MKVFKIVLTAAIGFSGYIGYNNFIVNEPKIIDIKESIEAPSRSIEGAGKSARQKLSKPQEEDSDGEKEEPFDTDFIIKIIETVSPLLAPVLASKKRKDDKGNTRTLDDELSDVAVKLGVSKAFVKGKLGLGDRRKSNINRTMNKRRKSD